MSDTDQPPRTPDRPAAVEELLRVLEECHAELAREGAVTPTLIDAPAEIERLVDEILDGQLDTEQRRELVERVDKRGQPTDDALREALAGSDPVADGGWSPEPADLRDGETRDDDSHAQQLTDRQRDLVGRDGGDER